MPSVCVRDVGFAVDADLSMKLHVQRRAAECFAVLRQLCSIRRSVPSTVLQSLVAGLVLPRLAYGSATLVDMSACQLGRLQSVLNAVARSVSGMRCNERITDGPILTVRHYGPLKTCL